MRTTAILVSALLLLGGCGEAIEAQESQATSHTAPRGDEAAPPSAEADIQPEIKLQDPVTID